jgi:hypothetical protein
MPEFAGHSRHRVRQCCRADLNQQLRPDAKNIAAPTSAIYNEELHKPVLIIFLKEGKNKPDKNLPGFTFMVSREGVEPSTR